MFAREHDGHAKLGRSENYVLQEHRPPSINGNHDVKSERVSRNTSPEATKQAPPAPAAPIVTTAAVAPEPVDVPKDMLGPWEPSLCGFRPFEEVSKRVADWLYVMVVSNPNSVEIHSRGIQIEVEAKLGIIIDRDTNRRLEGFMDTECLLKDTQKTAFQSSMNEVSVPPNRF